MVLSMKWEMELKWVREDNSNILTSLLKLSMNYFQFFCIHWYLWKPVYVYEYPSMSMDTRLCLRIPAYVYGYLSMSMDTCLCLWIPIYVYGYLSMSIDTRLCLWILLYVYEYLLYASIQGPSSLWTNTLQYSLLRLSLNGSEHLNGFSSGWSHVSSITWLVNRSVVDAWRGKNNRTRATI